MSLRFTLFVSRFHDKRNVSRPFRHSLQANWLNWIHQIHWEKRWFVVEFKACVFLLRSNIFHVIVFFFFPKRTMTDSWQFETQGCAISFRDTQTNRTLLSLTEIRPSKNRTKRQRNKLSNLNELLETLYWITLGSVVTRTRAWKGALYSSVITFSITSCVITVLQILQHIPNFCTDSGVSIAICQLLFDSTKKSDGIGCNLSIVTVTGCKLVLSYK